MTTLTNPSAVTRPNTAVERCAAAIRDAILRRDLPVGGRLPPERKLAEQLDVNRTTLRAALGRLETRGLLTVRQGSGYVVQDYSSAGGPDLLPGLAALARQNGQLPVVAGDLLAMRRHLAMAVLERLAVVDIAIDELQARVDEMADAVEASADVDELAQADLAVLAALLDVTGSEVFKLCFNPVAAVVHELRELREAMYADPQTNIVGWSALLAWLQLPKPRPLTTVAALLSERDGVVVATLKELCDD